MGQRCHQYPNQAEMAAARITCKGGNDPALGRDHQERGPRRDPQLPPQNHISIINHWVGHPIAQHCIPDGFTVLRGRRRLSHCVATQITSQTHSHGHTSGNACSSSVAVQVLHATHLLVVKLCRVDTHYAHRLTGVFALERRQFRQHMHAVDAAICPEIQHQDLSLQLPARRPHTSVPAALPLSTAYTVTS